MGEQSIKFLHESDKKHIFNGIGRHENISETENNQE